MYLAQGFRFWMMSPKWPQVYSKGNNIKWPRGFKFMPLFCSQKVLVPRANSGVKFGIHFKPKYTQIVWAPTTVTGEVVRKK